MTLCPCKALCKYSSCNDTSGTSATLFVLLQQEESVADSTLSTKWRSLIQIKFLDQNLLCCWERWLFSLFFHTECILCNYLACTVLLWVKLLHIHPFSSAQSGFPVVFAANVSSQRWLPEWYSSTLLLLVTDTAGIMLYLIYNSDKIDNNLMI